MNILYIFLTILMFLDCFILILLVLLQLPKKEAGAGVAFGAGATDALFGAGSGNVLTKITKYAAGIFFGLALIMAMIASNQARQIRRRSPARRIDEAALRAHRPAAFHAHGPRQQGAPA